MGVFHGKVNQSVGPNALVLSDDLCRVFSTEAAIKTDSKPLDKNKKDLCLSDVVHKHVDISKCIDPGLHPMLVLQNYILFSVTNVCMFVLGINAP